MFGKRGNNPEDSAPRGGGEPEFRSAAPSGDVAVAAPRSPEPRAVPIPPAAVPASAPVAPSIAHKAPPASRPMVRERSESYYDTKSQVFSALIDTIDLSQLAKLDPDSAREEIRDIVNDIIAIKNFAMSISEQEELLEDICNDVLGYGPLEPLLARDDIADIMVNGAKQVYIEVNGKVEQTGVRFRDNQQLLNVCQRIVSQVGRRVDESSRSATPACPTAAASTSSRRRFPLMGPRSPSASSRRTS
jgi:pilus assembly protein CpaF